MASEEPFEVNAKFASAKAKRAELFQRLEGRGFSIVDHSVKGSEPKWTVTAPEGGPKYFLVDPEALTKDQLGQLQDREKNASWKIDRVNDTSWHVTVPGAAPARTYDVNPDVLTGAYDPDRPVYQGFWKEWKKDSARTVERVGAAILGAAGAALHEILSMPDRGGPQYMNIASYTGDPVNEKLAEDATAGLRKWGDALYEDSKSWSLQPGRDGGFKDFVRQAVISTVPYMGATMASGLAGGMPGAFLMGSVLGGDQMRRYALDQGALLLQEQTWKQLLAARFMEP
jgi:hypothetical protein